MTGKPYSIVLADDHVMFRQGIKDFLEKIEGIQVSGEATNRAELLENLKISTPDLIILDLAMPRLRGLEALQEIKKRYPQIKVLILTMYGSEEFIREAVAAGAAGYILKEESRAEVVNGIEAIRKGSTYFSPKLSGALKNMITEKGPEDYLTVREKEVLRHLARGLDSQQIADALFISPHTVRRHRHNILIKLKLRSTAELIKYALSHGYGE